VFFECVDIIITELCVEKFPSKKKYFKKFSILHFGI
jgi:hypothetical protein